MAENRFHTEITASAAQFNAEMDASAQRMISDGQRMQSGWREGFYQMGQSGAGMAKQLNASFDGVKDAIKSLRGVLAGAAAVAGGAAFLHKFAQDAANAANETAKLARLLNITTQEASALKIALDDIGSDSGTYVSAIGKLTMGLRENEERFNALGVVTRDTNDELLGTDEIMRNALQALLQFKEGTDRNLASTELFAKGWEDVQRLLKLTPAAMEAARIKAQELQTEVGPAGAAKADAYRRAVGDVRDMISALANRVGQALMPVLTDAANWFASIGPAAVVAMRGAMGGLLSVWYGLANAVTIVWQLVGAFLHNVTEPLVGFGEAMALALTGNFAAAGARLRSITPNIKAAWIGAWEEILKSGDKTRERILALFDPNAEQGKGAAAQTGTRSYVAASKDKGASPSRLSEWEAALAAMRDAFDKEQMLQGTFHEFSKAQERDYWKALLERQDLSNEERAAVSKKYYAVERDIRKAAFESEIEDLKSRIEAEKQGADERVRLAEEIARRVGEKFGLESKEFRAAQADIEKHARDNADRRRKLEELHLEALRNFQVSRVEFERATLDTLETLGAITASEKLARLRELKEIEFRIELQAAEERAALLKADEIAYRQMLERIAELRRKHAVDMEQQRNKEAEQKKKDVAVWLDPIGDAIQRMVDGMLQGTQRLSDVFRNMMRNLLVQFLSTLARMAIEWIKTEIVKTQATAAGAAARTAAEASGSAAASGFSLGGAIQTIGAKAWEAASSVYASIAQIPVVGPFLAPAMAIAAAATVLGFIGKISSAAQGFNVPAGLNPITQLHSEEMVLPADIANPLRSQLAGGGVGGGGDTYNIYAMDARSFREYARSNAHALAPALRKLSRNFSPTRS